MPSNSSIVSPAWTGSRYGFVAFFFVSLLAGWSILRLVLFLAFRTSAAAANEVTGAFLSGFQRDCLVGLLLLLPMFIWFLIVPERWMVARWHRRLFFSAAFLFWFIEIFLLFVEYFFFEEFRSRFNTVAVDYLLYPQEVFINIWESYHLGIVLAV